MLGSHGEEGGVRLEARFYEEEGRAGCCAQDAGAGAGDDVDGE